MDREFQFFLLGVPEMVWQTRPYRLVRRQARALLYRLADDLQPVTRDQLIFLLWPDKSEATARHNLRRLLSYTRQSLPNNKLLLVNKTTVTLNPDLVASDTVHFTGLCAAKAGAGWETAAALYRGRFLDSFALTDSYEFDQWLGQAQRHYERMYLDVLRKLVLVKTDEQDRSAAIHYAQHYLATDDLAEEIHRQLITLYAANGDHSASFRQYEECTIVLERELGVPPLPETRAAYEAVRSGSRPPAPKKLPKPEWTTLPGLDLPLIGRDEAWQSLTEAYNRFQNGGVIFISGEAGVGKSRLMEEFATAQSGAQSCLVLTGNSHATGQALPYQPLIQALRLALPLPNRWTHTPPIWLTEISQLLPEIRASFPDLPRPVETVPAQGQARLFEALIRVFTSLAMDSALLLCLDDVHWADEATLAWLQYATKGLPNSGICILTTYRSHEPESLAGWQRELNRAGLATSIRLDGLSKESVAQLLVQTKLDQLVAKRIFDATGGNAFFVLETIRELLGSGHGHNGQVDLPLAQTIRDVVLHRVARLTPLAQQIITMAAVLWPQLTVDTLLVASGRGELEVADGLDELAAHQMLITDGSAFRFQHDLARQAIYEDLTPWRQRLLHRRAAEALEHIYAASLSSFFPRLVHHWSQVINDGQPDPELVVKVIEYSLKAGEQAASRYANQEAIDYFRQALALLQATPADESRRNWRQETATQLYENLGDLLGLTGRQDEARDAYQGALAQVSRHDLIWQSRLHRLTGRTWESQQRFEAALQAYDQAETTLGQEPAGPKFHWWQAWLEIQLSKLGTYYWQGKALEMARLAKKVQPAVEEHGTPVQRISFFTGLVGMNNQRDRYLISAETRRYLEVIRTTSAKLDDLGQIAVASFQIGFNLLWLGDFEQAEKQLRLALAGAEEIGDLEVQTRCLTYLAILFRRCGQLEEVQHFAAQALAMAKAGQMLGYIGTAKANQAWLAWREGNLSEVQANGQAALEQWQGMWDVYPFQWTALWPMIGLAVTQDQISEAIDYLEILMKPSQQQLPELLLEPIEQALHAWQTGDRDTVRTQLKTAIEIAGELGYQ